MTIDRQSISVIAFPALLFAIYALLLVRLTYRCPDGTAVVLTRRGVSGEKLCKIKANRERRQRENKAAEDAEAR